MNNLPSTSLTTADDVNQQQDDSLDVHAAARVRAADRDAVVPPHRKRTKACRTYQDALPFEQLRQNIRAALKMLHEQKLDLMSLNHYVHQREIQVLVEDPLIRYERTAMTQGEEFPDFLDDIRRAPRKHNEGIKTKGGTTVIEEFSLKVVKDIINRCMHKIGPVFKALRKDLSEESLMMDITATIAEVQAQGPELWDLLRTMYWTSKQDARNTLKDPDLAMLVCIANACYSRSHHFCSFQKWFTIFLHSSGMGARALDAAHTFGLAMSQSWLHDGLEWLAETARTARKEAMLKYPWTLLYDNFNPLRVVVQQRLGNSQSYDAGTVGSVIIHKSPDAILPDPVAFRKQEALGRKNLLTAVDILEMDVEASARLRAESVSVILQFLTNCPLFSFATYEHKDDATFSLPPCTFTVPSGPEHVQEEHFLDVLHVDESSYEGTDTILQDYAKQCGLTEPAELKAAAERLTLFIKGDQLTTRLVRGLRKYRRKDLNSWDRLDNVVPVFGWLHATMALVRSIHEQFYGHAGMAGLAHAFNLLKRKGLAKPSTKGVFHQRLMEALEHVASAHFRDLWCLVGEVQSLDQLRDRSPEELTELAERIYDEYASTLALNRERRKKRDERDDVLVQSILFCRDVLDPLILNRAIKHGRVGTMHDLLPRLLFRFVAGGNSHYSSEFLEALQSIEREWTPEVQYFVKRYCWLVNFTGDSDSFLPYDLAMEHNVLALKDDFAVIGPEATWEYLKKISPSIPIRRRLKKFVHEVINRFRRGSAHTNPSAELDIDMLQVSYSNSKIHIYIPGRRISREHRIIDYIDEGSNLEVLTKKMDSWDELREKERSTEEDWDDNRPHLIIPDDAEHDILEDDDEAALWRQVEAEGDEAFWRGLAALQEGTWNRTEENRAHRGDDGADDEDHEGMGVDWTFTLREMDRFDFPVDLEDLRGDDHDLEGEESEPEDVEMDDEMLDDVQMGETDEPAMDDVTMGDSGQYETHEETLHREHPSAETLMTREMKAEEMNASLAWDDLDDMYA